MKLFKLKFFFTALIFLPISMNITAQMPDWKFFKDREGNKYFIDRNGKIWTSGKPEFIYRPVSPDGIEYYLRQGIELVDSHYPVEGLVLLKSILALQPRNARVYRAQKEASSKINYMKKREGDRFTGMNESASLLLVRDQGRVSVINDRMFYSLVIPAGIKVLRNTKRGKNDYFYNGILIGIRRSGDTPAGSDEGFDFLLAIDSERFRGGIKNIEELEDKWRMTLWESTYNRTVTTKDDSRVTYRYTTLEGPGYSGYEGIVVNNRYGYMIRTITTDASFPGNDKLMKEIIEGFRFVGQR